MTPPAAGLRLLIDLYLPRALRPTLAVVLLHLVDDHKVVTVRELATAIGLTPSTTARHLRALHARGILEKAPKYRHDQPFELRVVLDPIIAPASNPTTTSRRDASETSGSATGPDSAETTPEPWLEPPEEEPRTPTPGAAPGTPSPHAVRDATTVAVRAAAEPLETPEAPSSRGPAPSNCSASTDLAIPQNLEPTTPEQFPKFSYSRNLLVLLTAALLGLALTHTHLLWGVLTIVSTAWILTRQPHHPAPPQGRHWARGVHYYWLLLATHAVLTVQPLGVIVLA